MFTRARVLFGAVSAAATAVVLALLVLGRVAVASVRAIVEGNGSPYP
jgi:hypothetical protein